MAQGELDCFESEFQYREERAIRGEEELFHRHNKKTAQTRGDRLVVIRTADLGADKQASLSGDSLTHRKQILLWAIVESVFAWTGQICLKHRFRRHLTVRGWYGNLGSDVSNGSVKKRKMDAN